MKSVLGSFASSTRVGVLRARCCCCCCCWRGFGGLLLAVGSSFRRGDRRRRGEHLRGIHDGIHPVRVLVIGGEPRMGEDAVDGQPLGWVGAHHLSNEILDCLRHIGPELVGKCVEALDDLIVERRAANRFAERRIAH